MFGRSDLNTVLRVVSAFAMCLLVACTATKQSSPSAADPHAGHNMQMQPVEPDQYGRQLHGMTHAMSTESLAELRERNIFPPYMTDEQISQAMVSMGSNYVWYVSGEDVRNKRGVLLLAHGFGDRGDSTLRQQMKPVGDLQPTALALGMSMMMSDHIQLALDDLSAAGAREIVVVPAASSRFSTLMRQWEYIFGLQKEPEYATVPRVSSAAKIHFAKPIDAHPLVAEILVEHATAISKDPAVEEVVVIGHGPIDADDNKAQLKTMDTLAEPLRALGFASVTVATLQDDAPREVRQANVGRLRQAIEDIEARGNTALVITNLLGTRIVQRSISRDLQGLEYRYNFTGIIQSEKFVDWVNLTVDEARF
jgi:sirohydrochlorin cobaltochelatase